MNIGHKLLLPLAWVVVAFCCCALRAQEQMPGLKSAIVEYQYESKGMGSTMTGTKKVWLADYGRKQATLKKEKTVTKVFGMGSTEEKESLSILDGEFLIDIDLKAKTGVRMRMAQMKDFVSAYTQEVERQGKTMEQHRDEWVKKHNGRWIEGQTILGRSCKGLEIFGMRQWLYEQLTLKMEGSVMGVTTKELATSLQENASFSADVFKVPAGIKIEDAPDMSGLFSGKEAGKAMASEEGEMGGLAALMQQAQAEAQKAEKGEGSEGATERGSADSEAGRPETPCGIPYGEFKSMVGKVKVPDMGKPQLESSEGSHTATYMKSLLNSVMIIAGGYITPEEYIKVAKEGREGSVSVTNLKRYTKKGHPIVYSEVGVGEGSPAGGSQLMVFDNARNATLMVTSQPARSRADLEAMLTQMGY